MITRGNVFKITTLQSIAQLEIHSTSFFQSPNFSLFQQFGKGVHIDVTTKDGIHLRAYALHLPPLSANQGVHQNKGEKGLSDLQPPFQIYGCHGRWL